MHTEWTDICILNSSNFKIQRQTFRDEVGTYKIYNEEIIINWDKWTGSDIFVKINDNYIHKIFNEINVTHIDNILFYIMNTDKNIIYLKNNISKFGHYSINDNNILISWNNNTDEKIIKFENNYYHEKYILNLISTNKKNSKEKFKKINDKYYYDINIKHCKQHTKQITHNKIYNHNVIDFDFNHAKIKQSSKNIIVNNYINIKNINKYIDTYIYDNLFNDLLNLEIDFEIKKKTNKKRCLTLAQWGYPAFGGGENWLLNFNKILNNNLYETFLICFSDPFKNEYFTNIKLIDLEYVKIIQMPLDILTIIKFIKIIDPDIINHQGVNRLLFMKISNILNIPFLTGFCYWNDIVKFNMDNININMLNNDTLEKTDDFEYIIDNAYTYVASDFVNDVINKLYNIKLDVIETISIKDDFYIDSSDISEKKYVTLINCHYNKGGYLIKYLCENLDINIPLQFVYTENDPNITIDIIQNLINERNKLKNINLLIPEKIDILKIYSKTKVLLIPSLCDETFCRVGYEGMINKIPIISSRNGNLKYLLKNYAIFINDYKYNEWKENIEYIYNDININLTENIQSYNVSKYNLNDINNNLTEIIISKKIINKIQSSNISKYNLNDKNIGLILPWADQGLGIQGREYYLTLKSIGYTPYIFSFKPYHSTRDNIYLQCDSNEWDYENITYSNNYRENITYEEIMNFVYKFNIKKIIIIEASFTNIFKIALFLKILNISIYIVVNIECIRLVELSYHNIFDKILTNNIESYVILSSIFVNKTKYLGFNIVHHYFNDVKKLKIKKTNIKKLKFCCIGGLNSISRKNIDLIVLTFYNIFIENIYLDWELNIYIQGIEIPDLINKYKCKNINYYINHFLYKYIIEKNIENDIFIHMGSHEGFGLGLYEAIYCGTPILTMNWIPNNEIIKNYINGWLINCTFSEINDNDNSLINRGIIHENVLKSKLIEIITDKYNTLRIINTTIENIANLNNINKYIFENNLIDILSTSPYLNNF